MKAINFKMEAPPYHSPFMVSIGETDAEFKKKAIRFGIDKKELEGQTAELPKESEAFAMIFPCNRALIRFRDYPKTPYQKGIFAHEIFHLADHILTRAGLQLTGESCEAYAYLIGYLTEEIYKRL